MSTKIESFQPGVGVRPSERKVTLYARGGNHAKGVVYQLDIANSDAAVSNNTVGDAASGFANAVAIGTDDNHGNAGPFVLALEAVTDDTKGEYLLYGIADALGQATSGWSIGDALFLTDGETGKLADGARALADLGTVDESAPALAIATEAGGAGTLTKVWFDGVNGFPQSVVNAGS